MTEYKYIDKNHPPVPLLKVGDRCYAHSTFGKHYYYVSVCEVRKVEVVWFEPNDYEKKKLGWIGHYLVNYYIRADVDKPSMKSTKMYSYQLGDDGRKANLFLTPQEVMDENIREFKDMVTKNIENMRRTMFGLGYAEEQTKKLLEYNV